MLIRSKVVAVKMDGNQPHRGREQEGCRVGANPALFCDTSPRRGWVTRGGLCQDEQGPPLRTGEPTQEPEGRRPQELWAPSQEPGGHQPKDWLSGTLSSTFLTPAGSSRSWRSTTDVLDFAHYMLEIAPGFCFPRFRAGGRGGCGKLYDRSFRWSSWS